MTTPDDIQPLTADRWADLERLFGPRGAYGNCWCMYWRVTGREFSESSGGQLRARLRERAAADPAPGLLAYAGDEPVGWVAVAPRKEFGRLNRSPKLKPVDDEPVWSIPCFFIDRAHRGQGVATALLDAAVDLARTHGATTVEGYPIDTSTRRDDGDLYTGTLSLFAAAGFTEVARRGGRPIVRRPTR